MTHEGIAPLQRVIAISHEIRQGDLYPRWLSVPHYGSGSVFFIFYSPLFYLSASFLHVLGIPLVLSIKAICLIIFFSGGLGMFLWAREHSGSYGALIAATL